MRKMHRVTSYSTWLHGEMFEAQTQRHLHLTG